MTAAAGNAVVRKGRVEKSGESEGGGSGGGGGGGKGGGIGGGKGGSGEGGGGEMVVTVTVRAAGATHNHRQRVLNTCTSGYSAMHDGYSVSTRCWGRRGGRGGDTSSACSRCIGDCSCAKVAEHGRQVANTHSAPDN